jgi:hypothetical protein
MDDGGSCERFGREAVSRCPKGRRAKGAANGIGKGMANTTSKTGCAMFGVLAYPSAGVAKSLKSSVYSATRKKIVEARHAEGTWLMENGRSAQMDDTATTFQGILKGGKR